MYRWLPSNPAERVVRWVDHAEPRYREPTLALWSLAFVFYAVGDTGLTTLVLELGGYEANPVARVLIARVGYAGLLLQKGTSMAVLWLLWRYYPTVGVASRDPWRLIVPAIPFLRGLQLAAIHIGNVAALL